MKYTIARVISSKPVEGKYGPQFNVFFTTNETGEQGISMFSKYEIKPGQEIEGEIVQKEGTRNGEPVTYHNFSFAKKDGSVNFTRMTELENKVTTLTLRHDKLVNLLIEKGIVPAPKVIIPGTTVEYPKEEIRAEEVTFDGAPEITEDDLPPEFRS